MSGCFWPSAKAGVLATAGDILSGPIVWDTKTGKRLGILPTPSQMPSHVVFSPSGKLAAAFCMRMNVQIMPGGYNGSGQNPTFNLWDVPRGRVIRKIESRENVAALGFTAAPVFSPDGKFVAFAVCIEPVFHGDRIVKPGFLGACVLDTATGKEKGTWPLRANERLGFLADNLTLVGAAIGDPAPQIQLCNIQTGEVKSVLGEEPVDRDILLIPALVLSPDNRVLASASPSHRITLWDVRTGRKLASFQGDQEKFYTYLIGSPSLNIGGSIFGGDAVKFSDDGRRLVSMAMYGDGLAGGPVPGPIVTKGLEVRAFVWDVEKYCAVQAQDDEQVQPGSEEDETEDNTADTATQGHAAEDAPPAAAEDDTEPPDDGEPRVRPRPLRTWTSADGQYQIEAELVGASGDEVILKSKDNRIIRLPIDKLSRPDQSYVRVMSKRPRN